MPSVPLPTRALGKNGPQVPAIGFGMMGMSHSYGAHPGDEERFALLDRAVEMGVTFWDSSDLYGDSEELVGKWFKRTGKRDQIFFATKFGYVKGSTTFEINSSYEYAKKACNESLRVLGIDYIDLYYLHNVNANTPIEQTMRALVELKAEGKIKHIGLSYVSAKSLRRAVKIGRVDCIQIDYSVVEREIETGGEASLLSTARELGVAVVCAMPLGRGLLTTTFASGQALSEKGSSSPDIRDMMMPRFSEENRDKNMEFVTKFKSFADKKGCTVPQLGIAWLLKQGDDIIPIPGTKRIKFLEQNVAALDISLSDAEEAEIRKFLDSTPVAGGPIPEQLSSLVRGDTKEEEP